MSERYDDELSAIDSTERLLEALRLDPAAEQDGPVGRTGAGAGAGDDMENNSERDDVALAMLTQWRAELDAAADTRRLDPTGIGSRSARARSRWRRNAAGVAAVAVVLAASTGAAAAASGPRGPLGELHQLFFGSPDAPARPDLAAIQATEILERVQTQLAAADRAGGITAAERAQVTRDLGRAARLLHGDANAPEAAQRLLAELRAKLAALPHLADQVGPDIDRHGSAGGTEPGDDHGGRGSGTDDSTSGGSGSDDGSSSGDDRSGSDGGDGTRSGSGGSGGGATSGDDTRSGGSSSGTDSSGSGDSSAGSGSDSSGADDSSGSSGSDTSRSGDSSGSDSSGSGDISGSDGSGSGDS